MSHPISDVRVVLVNGVGLAPSLFGDLVAELAPLSCVTIERRGYRAGTTPTADLSRLVADVDDVCTGPTVLVGLSGGATIGLALAIHQSATIRRSPLRVIVHEPLVGPLVPELHRAVSARADVLVVSPGAESAERFVEGLVGASTWAALPDDARAFTRRHHEVARAEVSAFTTFAPSMSDLRSVAPGLTVTVGSASPQARHDVAAVLRRAGADTIVVPGAGHLAPWEKPVAYATVVRAAVDSLVAA